MLHFTVVEEDIPGLLPLSFQEKQGAMINLRTNKLHLPHLRAVVPMHRTQDDGTDASHLPCTRRSFAPIWVVLALVCNGRYSRELNSRWQRPTRDERRYQECVSSYGVDSKTTRKNLQADLSFHVTSQHGSQSITRTRLPEKTTTTCT